MEETTKDSINDGSYNWTVSELKNVLASSRGLWGAKGTEFSWKEFVDNLNKGLISVQIEECPLYEIPNKEKDHEEWVKFSRYAADKRGNSLLVHMRWCGFKWALEKYGVEPFYPITGANGYVEGSEIAIKAGEIDIQNLTQWLLRRTKVAVFPYPTDTGLYVYTFSAKEEFIKKTEELIFASIDALHERMRREEEEYLHKRSKN